MKASNGADIAKSSISLNYKSIAASIRSPNHVLATARAGAHRHHSYRVFSKCSNLTDAGIAQFLQDCGV